MIDALNQERSGMLTEIKSYTTKYKQCYYIHPINNLNDRVDDFLNTTKLCKTHVFKIQFTIRDTIVGGFDIVAESFYSIEMEIYANEN